MCNCKYCQKKQQQQTREQYFIQLAIDCEGSSGLNQGLANINI